MRTFGLVLLLAAAALSAYMTPVLFRLLEWRGDERYGMLVLPAVAAVRWLLVSGGLLAAGAGGGNALRGLGVAVLPAVVEAVCLWVLYVAAMPVNEEREILRRSTGME